jgi:hypothetical protein
VWGLIGLVVIGLIGAGVYFFLLSPKSNNPAVSTTPQPTSAAAGPTTVGESTKPVANPSKTVAQPTKVAGQPTTAIKTSVVPTLEPEPTSVTSNPTTGPSNGQGGFAGSPHDAANTFFNDLRTGNYAAAQQLLLPEVAAGLTPDVLQTLWQSIISAGGDITVGDATENGNSAEVAITWNVGFGVTQNGTVTLVNQGGKWYIENPLNITSDQPIEIPTFEPGEFPTFEPVEIPTP